MLRRLKLVLKYNWRWSLFCSEWRACFAEAFKHLTCCTVLFFTGLYHMLHLLFFPLYHLALQPLYLAFTSRYTDEEWDDFEKKRIPKETK